MAVNFIPSMDDYTGQGAFRFWCQTALPLVYDDSLSYYELLNKVVAYLNNVISDVSAVETNVDRLLNAFAELQGYVNNYFDNLDVQQEINNKLDGLAEDGTLSELIAPFVTEQIGGVVADQIGDVVAQQIGATVAGQIVPVVAEQLRGSYGSPLVASTLDEMTDHQRVYVYTGSEADMTNGDWYYWDGDSWESGGVYNAEAITVDDELDENSINPVQNKVVTEAVGELKSALSLITGSTGITLTHGYYITTSTAVGSIVDLTPSANSAFNDGGCAVIDCIEGDLFEINGSGSSNGRLWAFVDSSNKMLQRSGANVTGTNLVLMAPKDAAKLIINSKTHGSSIKNTSVVIRLSSLKEALVESAKVDIIDFDRDYYIDNHGNTVDITAHVFSLGTYCAVVSCNSYEIFTINGIGGNGTYRLLWTFIDTNGNVLSAADASVVASDSIIVAPYGATHLVINAEANSPNTVCFKGYNVGGEFDNVEAVIGKKIEMSIGFVVTSNSTVNLADANTNANWRYAVVPCGENDVFLINSTGGSNYALPWTFIDDEMNVLSRCADSTAKNTLVIAPADAAYLIINTRPTVSSMALSGALSQYLTKRTMAKSGRQVLMYHFGGGGNDWCWVRTPSDYDPDRAKPYPFVICNHGNGFVPDGTVYKANYTQHTMYLPTDNPAYIDNPSDYNATDNPALYGSSPTIEALLTAGYVVCGCANYADALYGNNNCRNACADFYYHMISHYNVEKRCYMIGYSNGCMTTLNAVYLLQGHVKGVILQAPLVCLVNHYEHQPNHQAAIRSAYGITDPDISEADLTIAVATHDPYTVDVVSDKKIGVFPPTKMYYSPDDTLVDCDYNAIPMAALLTASNKVVETVVCSGGHGNHSHFDPPAFVAWLNAN